MGTSVSLSSGFHPESNGQTERVNQALAWTLRCLTCTNPSSWAEYLPWQNMPMTLSGIHPWACHPLNASLGFLLPCSLKRSTRLGFLLQSSLCSIAEAHGQWLWLSSKNLPLHVESKKLPPRYVEPFKVDQHISPVTYWLRLLPSMQIHPAFHVSCLRLLLCGTRPPALCLVSGSPAYMVRHLLDSRCVRGGIQYLVDWEGLRNGLGFCHTIS
ncbi:hypothetical protein MHYP_G00151420 [Metynnis hypsauchen]